MFSGEKITIVCTKQVAISELIFPSQNIIAPKFILITAVEKRSIRSKVEARLIKVLQIYNIRLLMTSEQIVVIFV